MVNKNEYRLFKRVIELSHSNTWEEAKKEWEEIRITEVEKGEDSETCTCGHYPIREVIQLFNNKTRNSIIVGNCCVNRFFGIKDYNKIFSAIKKGKVNHAMIKHSFEKGIINEWERDFMESTWRKKKLSIKQRKIIEKIVPKIMRRYKEKPVRE